MKTKSKMKRNLLRGTLTGIACWGVMQVVVCGMQFGDKELDVAFSWALLYAWLLTALVVTIGLQAVRFAAFARCLLAAALTAPTLCLFFDVSRIYVQYNKIEMSNGDGIATVVILMMGACGFIAGTLAAGIITFVRQRKNALSNSPIKQEDAPSQGSGGVGGENFGV